MSYVKQIQRYSPKFTGWDMEKDDVGDYVEYEDFRSYVDAMQAEIEQLQEQIEEMSLEFKGAMDRRE